MLKFGTDGLRGEANIDLAPEVALLVGRIAARVLGRELFAVGRDTRRSGTMLEAAFAAGLASEGAEVVSLGVAPTPEVAWWARAHNAPAAVISASHNLFYDNGIKLFAAGGRKLSDSEQYDLEIKLTSGADGDPLIQPEHLMRRGSEIGSIRSHDGVSGYVGSVVASVGDTDFDGLSLVVDCANGAASGVAPGALRQLGAQVEAVHCHPDGININAECGSTHPEALQAAVVEAGADVGVAFDGDADRVLLVDANGGLVDGDEIMAILALDRSRRGLLRNNTVVVTVMTNLGFRRAMDAARIEVVETPVGDRYVLEAMEQGDYILGGEQSGHVILSEFSTTGDGLLTAAQVLETVARTGRPLAELAAASMTRLPQVLRNIQTKVAPPVLTESVGLKVAEVERGLGEDGRVLVRPSGTERLIRIMVEATDADVAEAAADQLEAAVRAAPN